MNVDDQQQAPEPADPPTRVTNPPTGAGGFSSRCPAGDRLQTGPVTDRYAAMVEVRAGEGWAPTPMGRYIATAAGVRAGLQDVNRFVGSFLDTSRLPADEVVISAVPEPEHGRIRKVINTAIAAHRLAPAGPFIRDTAVALVEAAVARARAGEVVDLIEWVSDPLPTTVIAHVLGVPVADRERFRRWSDELLTSQEDGLPRTLSQAHEEFADYIQRGIDARRTAVAAGGVDAAPDDVITRLMNTEIDGALLSDAAVRTQVMFLIIAGNETTRNLIGNCLHTLATDPALYARVRADPALVPVLIEESLRYDSPVQILARETLAAGELDRCPLERGDRVVFGVASANRDEAVFEAPDEFRLDRPYPRDHLAFGTGPHVCPGAALARTETVALLEEFVAAVESFAPVDDFEPSPNPVFWALGHRALPCVLTAAKR